ncbi:hypothetical protein LFM09_28210 [Lentzea alba]|uniref:hypothetical protein n=1 Tax=Lentzea alba TaxID=2714351 RepID=UPI0039BFC751
MSWGFGAGRNRDALTDLLWDYEQEVKPVVLAVLLLVDDHEPWLEPVPGDQYALCRSHEIGMLRRASELGATWSDWLRLRLAEVQEPAVLRPMPS